jgi:hypothetical protein
LTEQQKAVLAGNMAGIDTSKMPLSDMEEIQQQLQEEKEGKSELEKKLNEQRSILGRQLNENKAATTAALAQSREDVYSTGNKMTTQNITGAMQATYNMQMDQLEQTQKQYDKAIQEGDYKTADSLAQSIGQQQQAMAATAAENKKQSMDLLKQLSDTGAMANLTPQDAQALQASIENGTIPPNLVGLLSQAATTKSLTETKKAQFDLQKSALDTFKGLATEGIQMTPAMLKQMSSQTGLPVDTLMEFNNNAQAIMQDKTMDTATKQLALQRNSLLLDQEQHGIYGQDMQKMAYIDSLYARGASQQEIDSVKTMLGITTDSRQEAETAIKQAEASIKAYEAKYQGQPPPEGSLERVDYDKKKLDLKEAQIKAGQNYGANLEPSTAKEAFALAGKSRVTSSFAEGHKECGEAVNDLTDGARMGSSYASKMATVTKKDNPQVGNALVIPIGNKKYGHTETVISVNQVTGDFQTVSYNRDNHGTQTIQNYNINDLTKYGDNWGFNDNTLKPEYQEKLNSIAATGTGDAAQVAKDIMNPASGLKLSDLPPAKRAEAARELNKLKDQSLKSGDLKGYVQASAGGTPLPSTGVEKLNKALMVNDQLAGLQSTIETMDTGPITGSFRSLNPYDVDRAKLKAQLQAIVPNLARGIYGEVGVLTDQDINNYIQTLPNGFSTADQKAALMKLTQDVVKKSIKTSLKTYAMNGNDISGFAPLIDELGLQDGVSSTAGLPEWATSAFKGFAEQLLHDTHDQTGQYALPEDLPQTNYTF